MSLLKEILIGQDEFDTIVTVRCGGQKELTTYTFDSSKRDTLAFIESEPFKDPEAADKKVWFKTMANVTLAAFLLTRASSYMATVGADQVTGHGVDAVSLAASVIAGLYLRAGLMCFLQAKKEALKHIALRRLY